MSIRQIIYVILSSIILALSITVIVLSCALSSTNRKLVMIETENNHLSQTVDKMKQEATKQEEIYREKDELLLEVKNSHTLPEYLIIWDKINKSLK